jgi:parallel beta-helix repeat protein
MRQPLRNTAKFALQTGLVLALLGAGVPVQAATSITTCGFTITTLGTYNVANDLTGCALDGIDIKASNVTLNLNGHKITGATGGTFTGIWVNPSGGSQLSTILIQGPGLIQGFHSGIAIYSSANVKVDHVTSALNIIDGLFAGKPVGSLTNLAVTDSVFAGNGRFGILLDGSTNGNIVNNDASGNASHGIFLEFGSNNQVVQNIANGNQAFGISLFEESGSSANNNTTIGNPFGGIGANGSAGLLVQYNTSEGNAVQDMFEFGATCGTDTWQFNTFFTSNAGCIH